MPAVASRVVGTRLPLLAMIRAETADLKAFYNDYTGAKRPAGIQVEYLRKVIQSHRELLSKWKAWRIHIPLDGGNQSVSHTEFNAILNRALKKFPKIKLYADVGGAIMISPVYSSLFAFRNAATNYDGTILSFGKTVPIRAGQSVAKPVLAFVRKTFAKYPEYVKLWEYLFQELGELWARRHSQILTLSTAPSDWLRLGHAGGHSCYATGGENEYNKIILSKEKNTVVAYLWRSAEAPPTGDKAPNWGAVTARCWLFAVPEKGFIASNAYGLRMDTFREHLLKTAPIWLGTEVKEVQSAHSILDHYDRTRGFVYVNEDTILAGTAFDVVTAVLPPKSPLVIRMRAAEKARLAANISEDEEWEDGFVLPKDMEDENDDDHDDDGYW